MTLIAKLFLYGTTLFCVGFCIYLLGTSSLSNITEDWEGKQRGQVMIALTLFVAFLLTFLHWGCEFFATLYHIIDPILTKLVS